MSRPCDHTDDDGYRTFHLSLVSAPRFRSLPVELHFNTTNRFDDAAPVNPETNPMLGRTLRTSMCHLAYWRARLAATGRAEPTAAQSPNRRGIKRAFFLFLVFLHDNSAVAVAEPQAAGWPLTDAETRYVLRPEHERRPGADEKTYQPALWPVTPTAGHWGGSHWLEAHTKLVAHARANRGPVDILLVGDSITQQWGSVLDGRPLNAAWQERFGRYKTVNVGLAGDKTQNVLWRLNHGGVDGLAPRLVVLLVGNNNMFFARETGVAAAARGIKACVENLRGKFPRAELIVATILPAHAPGHAFYEDIKQTNAALLALNLGRDSKVRVLDLWPGMIEADGTLNRGLFQPDNIHLTSEAGYRFLAAKLQPLIDVSLSP